MTGDGLCLLFVSTFLMLACQGALIPKYYLEETHKGADFINNFMFEAIPDPTHGRVNYVDKDTAIRDGLVSATDDSFFLRADATKVLSPSGPGRDSVRLISNRHYGNGVMVFDIRHMPQGCGSWPAVWTFAAPWPHGGEVDILEGVNDQGPNTVTLHTSEGCEMPKLRLQSGKSGQLDCNVAVNYNTGCGVQVNDRRSYGPEFNSVGGGWYAVERTNDYIKAWFWSRYDWDVPEEIRNGAGVVNPLYWGLPAAHFPSTDKCNIGEKFRDQNILINLTFCGDWAGNAYPKSGCPLTCVDFVNNHPEAFTEAYFDIGSLRIYS
ncbi:endo-beta-glucanase [Coprinopsis sp. MPI-PUGE-AT-0042]|nr:endo-beta-glucanase [Coprinopsis sp. MPI-PUGE-AT-0042]